MPDRSRSNRRRRRDDGPRLTTIYWRDIPAQVTARAGRERASLTLEDRFQVAIDGAATRAGKTSTEDYVAEWREENAPCGSDLEAEVEARKAQLEASFPPEVLRSYVRAGGFEPRSQDEQA